MTMLSLEDMSYDFELMNDELETIEIVKSVRCWSSDVIGASPLSKNKGRSQEKRPTLGQPPKTCIDEHALLNVLGHWGGQVWRCLNDYDRSHL